MDGQKDAPLSVAPYPVAWKVEIVNDEKHRSFDYVRLELYATRCVEAVH